MTLAATPAPDSTRIVWPCAFSFLAVSGVTATRVSPAAVSRGTPISMFLSPRAVAADGASLQERPRLGMPASAAPTTRSPRPTSIGRMNERWKPSVTVAAIVERRRAAARRAARFLLVEEETAEGLRLNNPAGHLDPGESPSEAWCARRSRRRRCIFTPERLVGVYLARLQRDRRTATT